MMMSVELALASGVTDSLSSLSYPYTNELVNSFIKAWAYTYAGEEDMERFSVFGRYGAYQIDVDFRKRLHIVSHLYNGTAYGRMWGCRCRYKLNVGSVIYWASLADFNVDEFKLVSALTL